MNADDTHLINGDNDVGSIESCLSQDLLNVHTWLNANKLTLNMTETKLMLIGSGQRLNTIAASPSIVMNGTRVKQVATKKSLGVTIDDKLSWNCQIEKLTKEIASEIGAMRGVRHLVPQATLHLTIDCHQYFAENSKFRVL